MNFEEFEKDIIEIISKRYSGYNVTVQEVVKNNNCHLRGLNILATDSNVSPTIYINHYYEQYTYGREIGDIIEEIVSIYEDNRVGNIDISFFTDYSRIKDKITVKLVNYEQNIELLQEVPHRRFLDLAIVLNCLVDMDGKENASILIRDCHLDYWNISLDDIFKLAIFNTRQLLGIEVEDILKILGEMIESEPSFCEMSFPMLVLTNRYRLNGATCILYADILKNIANERDCDFYILPSSIHEVILVPAYDFVSCNELMETVKSVNKTVVSENEVLSDHVYYFSRETEKITIK